MGGGGWHKASVSDCLPLAAPIGLSPLLILTLCGPERVLAAPTEPPDDLSCLTTPGVGRPGDGLLPVPLTRCIQGGVGLAQGRQPLRAKHRMCHSTPPPCISDANVHNYYGPYAYCSLDKGAACAQHIQLPTHTCARHMC